MQFSHRLSQLQTQAAGLVKFQTGSSGHQINQRFSGGQFTDHHSMLRQSNRLKTSRKVRVLASGDTRYPLFYLNPAPHIVLARPRQELQSHVLPAAVNRLVNLARFHGQQLMQQAILAKQKVRRLTICQNIRLILRHRIFFDQPRDQIRNTIQTFFGFRLRHQIFYDWRSD